MLTSWVNGIGNSLLDGNDFGTALGYGGRQALIGAASGAVIGGITGGLDAHRDGRDFYDGGLPLEERMKMINESISAEVRDNAGLKEIKMTRGLVDDFGNRAIGLTSKGDIVSILEDGQRSYSDNIIELRPFTVRRISNGRIRGLATLDHELFHATDFKSGMASRIWNGQANYNENAYRSLLEYGTYNHVYNLYGKNRYHRVAMMNLYHANTLLGK